MIEKFFKKNKGFSILELLVSVAIFSVILLAVVSFFFSMSASNSKTKRNRDVLENIRRVLDKMAYEIKSAESIYTPTTSATQLSLETKRYLPPNENDTYIDFFLCGSAICLKREFQDPVALTPNSINITGLSFLKVTNGAASSVKISLTMSYAEISGSSDVNSSVSLETTAFLRNY